MLIKPRLLFERKPIPDQREPSPENLRAGIDRHDLRHGEDERLSSRLSSARICVSATLSANRALWLTIRRFKRFDYVLANPMWNQKEYNESFYDNDRWGRFAYGVPPSSSADWAWVQHMLASLNTNGRAAIVLDTGAVSRGSGNKHTNRERDIRKGFVENDLIEGVILLPENLFYNTSGTRALFYC